MAFKYEQVTGWMIDANETNVARGYSGSGVNKNNPDSQNLIDQGPIPQGFYTIGSPEDTETHGPYVLRLTPDPANEMFGRGGFLCHGDSVVNPGTASEGCIIMPRDARVQIWTSGDHQLQVVSGQ